MFHINFLEYVVIGGFQCVKPGHTPDFWKTRPDTRTGAKKEDVSGETRTYGNPTNDSLIAAEDGHVFLQLFQTDD